jgi:glutathione peroxidase
MKPMRAIIMFLGIAILSLFGRFKCNEQPTINMSEMPSNFHEFKIASLEGADSIDFSQYKGKYILCVNVASKCGYTPQYKGLQELYDKNKDKLVIVGFPCNQFLGQEPGTNEEIAEFCEKNYGVTFPITTKVNVKGKEQHQIYSWLTMKSLNGVQDDNVKWNFHKYLIGPKGEWLAAFPSNVEPDSPEIAKYLK